MITSSLKLASHYKSSMTNLDVAFASFWQLARHWNQGDKAKLELSCEDGSLQMQLSVVLGHPKKLHFPHPSPSHHSPPPAFLLQKKKKYLSLSCADRSGVRERLL